MMGKNNTQVELQQGLEVQEFKRLPLPLGRCNMHETCYTCTICHDEQLSHRNPYSQIIQTSCNGYNSTKHPHINCFGAESGQNCKLVTQYCEIHSKKVKDGRDIHFKHNSNFLAEFSELLSIAIVQHDKINQINLLFKVQSHHQKT